MPLVQKSLPQKNRAANKKDLAKKSVAKNEAVKKAPLQKVAMEKLKPKELEKPNKKIEVAPKKPPVVADSLPKKDPADSDAKPVMPKQYTESGLPIIENPGYLSKVKPLYPRRAQQRKQEGRVILDATVDTSGLVRSIKVFRSSGYKALDRSALRAVKQWRFKPLGKQSSQLVVMRIPVNFQLTGS